MDKWWIIKSLYEWIFIFKIYKIYWVMQHDDPQDPEVFYNTGKKQNNKRTKKAAQSLI